MNNQQQMAGESLTFRGGFSFLYLLVSGHAACLTPFLHSGFGSEALGVNGVAALVIILLYMAQTQSAAMVDFLYAWLVVLLLQRIRTVSLRRQGHIIHSRYDGYPWLANLVKSEMAAKGLEPFVCMFAGACLAAYDEALGQFVVAGFVSLILKMAIERRIDAVSVQRMRDAEIEQRLLIQRNKGVLRDY